MKYKLVYKEHDDKFGNWLVCNERGEYAAAPTGVAGAKPRRWLLSEDAVKYMQQRASVDVSFVWLNVPTVCQGKPGATSIRHAAAYKPAHGGYPQPTAPESSAPTKVNEQPACGSSASPAGSNEEACTIPDAVIRYAVSKVGPESMRFRSLDLARRLFPNL